MSIKDKLYQDYFNAQMGIKDKEIEKLQKENNNLRNLYQRTYKHLFEIGNDELAGYFQAQINECPTFYVEPIIDYAKEWKDYKIRIDKAIKLLKEAGCYDEDTKTFCDDIYYELPNILNVLEGSDKE